MKALAQKAWLRVVCLLLCLVFTGLGVFSWSGAAVCWQRGWYPASPYASCGTAFEDSMEAAIYANQCLYYAYSYIQWQGGITEDVIQGYSGDAFAIRITDDATGEVILDTTTENSRRGELFDTYYVDFPTGGTAALESSDTEWLPEHCWKLEDYVNLPPAPYSGCYAEYMLHMLLLTLRPWFIPVAVVSLLLALAFAVLLIWLAALYTPKKRTWVERLPAELPVLTLLLAALGLGGLGWTLMEDLWYYGVLSTSAAYLSMLTAPPFAAMCWTAAGLLAVWSVVRRCRLGILRQTLLAARIPAGWRQFALLLLATVVSFVWAVSMSGYYSNGWRWVFTVVLLLATVYSGVVAAQLDRLGRGMKELAAGRLDYKIRTEGLISGLWEQGEALNRIGEGMKLAVEERIRGERFRTELITNVSHDLKTPLTSIVSYVDLLKKENVESETAREYIDVLDRQSAKLKKLTEDLVEASKASAGAIAVHPEPTDVRELLSQSVGEYTERLTSCGVEAVLSLPEGGVVLDTDGRLLWRVLENLIQNIVKYAQPGTRAYFDLTREGEKVSIALKNTSAQPLNIPAEALLERFVRGDSARSTEGSGLGLSIAQSLTELLGGSMTLYLDGDLFKVTLKFEGGRGELDETAE